MADKKNRSSGGVTGPVVYVRVTETDKRLLLKAARRRGLLLAQWARTVMLEAAQKELPS